ncbi:MAG: flagellar basal body rod protein FlgB [Steroidobacteraceae bacterium]
MPISLDDYLAVHTASLRARSARNEILASNIANADTPNYKARDLDFATLMDSASPRAPNAALASTDPRHISSTSSNPDLNSVLRYRVPLAPSLDGNTVDPQLEQAAYAENVVRYQASLTFLGSKLRGLITAITGQ